MKLFCINVSICDCINVNIWLWYPALVLQDVITEGKWVNSIQDLLCHFIQLHVNLQFPHDKQFKNITKLIHKWSSITYNSSKTEATGMSFNWWVDKPVYPTHGLPFSATKGNKIIYATTWMNLKNTVLSEINKTPKLNTM